MFNQKEIIKKGNLRKKSIFIISLFLIVFYTIASANAHILIIGDSIGDLPNERQETIAIYEKLISDGYPVILLIGDNATSENIIKGMYGADAIIYIGHGSDLSYYQNDGGISKAPYAIPTSDNIGIWTNHDLLSEGLNIWGMKYKGIFIPPFKKGASVIFIHTCFATGWVQDTYVANPDETLYKFNIPYVNSGANVYSTGFYQVYDEGFFDGVLGQELANGGEKSLTFEEANKLANPEDQFDSSNSKEYNEMVYYTSQNGGSLFIGNKDSYVLPPASDCSEYDRDAANSWYDAGKPTNDPIYDESIRISSENSLENLFNYFYNAINGLFKNFIDNLLNI